MSRRIRWAWLILGVCSIAFSHGATCEGLTALRLEKATITVAHTVRGGTFTPPSEIPASSSFEGLPPFCRVEGILRPTSDSQIEFEVWMPLTHWNGRYLGVGNGGFAGSIVYPGLAGAVAAGYAASSTDTGHRGGMTSADWALGHPERVVDFGYRAIHETAERSKAIVKAFYGSNARYSYFSSCSNGGRQGLLEAQRYPADYDGIIAGAPANFWTHLLAGFIWNAQALAAGYIPPAKLKMIESAALAACDRSDGVQDGVIGRPDSCRFDPAVLRCRGAGTESCLTDPQIAALKKIYAGPRNSKGEQIFPGFLPGSETGLGGWASWITGPEFGKSVQLAFGKGFFGDVAAQNSGWDYRNFNLDRDVPVVDDELARTFNATAPDLRAFQSRGGKLILYHGWSDPAIAPLNSVNYYQSVVAKMGAKRTDNFLALYMVPGMQHCAGGPGPDEFGAGVEHGADPDHSLSASMERWVEKGIAPRQVIATKREGRVQRTRPLCPYPEVALYKGSGSTDQASNFTCVSQ